MAHVCKFPRVVAGVCAVLLFTTEYYSIAGNPHLVYPFISWWTCGSFPPVGVTNNAAVSTTYELLFLVGMYLGMDLVSHVLTL